MPVIVKIITWIDGTTITNLFNKGLDNHN